LYSALCWHEGFIVEIDENCRITGCDLDLRVRVLPVNIRVRVRLGLLMDMQAGLPSLR
jgi:hypothetical protein